MSVESINNTSFLIIQSAIEIHRVLGPGLLERPYRTCMLYELGERGLKVAAEQVIPVRYKNLVLEGGYRIDLLVQDEVIVELKSVEAVLPAPSCRRRRQDCKPIWFLCASASLRQV